jgi:hypothetical protein
MAQSIRHLALLPAAHEAALGRQATHFADAGDVRKKDRRARVIRVGGLASQVG